MTKKIENENKTQAKDLEQVKQNNYLQTCIDFIQQNAITLLILQGFASIVLLSFLPRKSPLEQSIEGLTSAAGALMSNTSKLMKYGQDFATATQPITDGVYSASKYVSGCAASLAGYTYGCAASVSNGVWSCFGAAGEATTKVVGDVVMDTPH